MTFEEILNNLKTVTDKGEITEIKMSVIDIVSALNDWKAENDELLTIKDKEISDRDEIITARDERIKELEDTSRRIVERYGEEILKKPVEVVEKPSGEEDENKPTFEDFII